MISVARFGPRLRLTNRRTPEPLEHVLARHGRTFSFAARFLPESLRWPVTVLYAFCRYLDDLVDEAHSAASLSRALEEVEGWRRWLAGDGRLPQWFAADAIAAVVDRCPAIRPPLVELCEGLAKDAAPRRFTTEAELDQYCHEVAGTVGVAMALLMGVAEPPALASADRLGRAMQRTNILRDIAEDLRRGRQYLPESTLAAYGLSGDDVAPLALRGVKRASFEAMLASQCNAVRAEYRRALRGVAYLPSDCRLAIAVAAYAYRRILDEIERLGVRVLERRASTSLRAKATEAFRAWRDLHWGELR